MADKGDVCWTDLGRTIEILRDNHTQHWRFSGGEPTLYPYIVKAVACASIGAKRVAISTNGSAAQSLYDNLIFSGGR
jgi:molybdenum cofactor biosynthesis enzyme MoaA